MTPPADALDTGRAAGAGEKASWTLGGVFDYASRVTPQRLVLLFVAGNLMFLAFDVFLAHGYSKGYFVVGYEWIPVIVSPLAALAALAMAASPRPRPVLTLAHLGAMGLVLAVGVVGFAMHLLSARGVTQQFTWKGMVYAAPLLAPLSFCGVALVGVIAAAEEDPARPGRLKLLGGRLAAPFSQQQHLHLLNGLGLLTATLLAIIDHSQGTWSNSVVWVPVVGGFGLTGLTLHHALLRRPSGADKLIYFWAMGLAMLIGLLGFSMHLWQDLPFSWEHFFKGPPPFAPMLFANMGVLGLLALIEPGERS